MCVCLNKVEEKMLGKDYFEFLVLEVFIVLLWIWLVEFGDLVFFLFWFVVGVVFCLEFEIFVGLFVSLFFWG